jgi:hypothetical protein
MGHVCVCCTVQTYPYLEWREGGPIGVAGGSLPRHLSIPHKATSVDHFLTHFPNIFLLCFDGSYLRHL